VYVQEVPSGVRPIAGVSTGTTLFIGASGRGPLDDPTVVLSHDEYVEQFGDDGAVSDMSRQVKLFFQNGGTVAYAMRIANGATTASVQLRNEADQPSLDITAANPGAAGEDIRLRVSYGTSSPDATFDMEVFRWEYSAGGVRTAAQVESFTGLSMDPLSSRYAPAVLTQRSQHVDAADAAGGPAAGTSQSGLAVPWRAASNVSFRTQWEALVGLAGPPAANQTFTISVDGRDPVIVGAQTPGLSGIDVASIPAASVQNDLADAIAQAVIDEYAAQGTAGVTLNAAFVAGPAITTGSAALHGDATFDFTSYLQFTSTVTGAVVVHDDGGAFARTLRLGVANGGREISPYAGSRPAPNALVHDGTSLAVIGALEHSDIVSITLDGQVVPVPASSDPTRPFFVPLSGGFVDGRGGLDGTAERLRALRDAVNTHAAATPTFRWTAEVWGVRLALRRTDGDDNALAPADFATAGTDVAGDFVDNTRFATVGIGGQNMGQQVSAIAVASDGAAPQAVDYDNAYTIAERELDIFNLLVLPQSNNGGADRLTLWGPASVFCQRNRAFLLIDPPGTWVDHITPIDGTGANDSIIDLRTGLVKDHAAVHFPNIAIDDGGRRVITNSSGAIAGLMARIDTQRGVWKAAAGTEADIRGIVGVQYAFSDGENGNLNPRAVNTIRRFPSGIVNWGARTMDGDNDTGSEYKYVPVRRLFLYLEESIYRGLQWTVFEPNGLDLWAAIRLNVGNFLNGLFRQGAFAGETSSQAYFVKCDAETTTPTDRRNGIVNVIVGVAPLMPAEFVVLSFRQITLPEQ
jgi:hypothetical protein